MANDHYHRYQEDVALMQSIGANAYRFSVAWPRIFPDGAGQANLKGLDFYSRLVDELLAAGIEPFATLYRWDLPQALHDRYGGWQSEDTAKAFADYAGYVAEQLGDRVKHYFTINEFASFVEAGYQGVDVQIGGGKTFHLGAAPGLRVSNSELRQVRHHAVLGHGLAVQAIRAGGPAGNLMLASVLIGVIWRYARTERLVRTGADDPDLVARITPSLGAYVVMIVVGLFLPLLAVLGYLAIAVYIIVPFRAIRRSLPKNQL